MCLDKVMIINEIFPYNAGQRALGLNKFVKGFCVTYN